MVRKTGGPHSKFNSLILRKEELLDAIFRTREVRNDRYASDMFMLSIESSRLVRERIVVMRNERPYLPLTHFYL